MINRTVTKIPETLSILSFLLLNSDLIKCDQQQPENDFKEIKALIGVLILASCLKCIWDCCCKDRCQTDDQPKFKEKKSQEKNSIFTQSHSNSNEIPLQVIVHSPNNNLSEEQAAILIQKVYRGHLARKNFFNEQRKQEKEKLFKAIEDGQYSYDKNNQTLKIM